MVYTKKKSVGNKMTKDDIIKSNYTGVYKKGNAIRPWFTFIRYNNGQKVILVHSDTEEKAALKYNILATFFQGQNALLNKVTYTKKKYREISIELFSQLTIPSEIQKAYTNQGYKKSSEASTEFVGVYKYPDKELYFAYITKNKKRYVLGYYKDKYTPAIAYNIAAIELYGPNAKLNDVNMDSVSDKFRTEILMKLNR